MSYSFMHLKKLLLLFATITLAFFVNGKAMATDICSTINGNLVQNCGFETGSFSSWTQTDATSGSDIRVFNAGAYSGTYLAGFGATQSEFDTISQNIATTPGSTYSLTFYLQGSGSGNNSEFIAQWGGV